MHLHPAVNAGKNWVLQSLAKQKPNVSKAPKFKLEAWGSNTYYVNGNY